jgi:hypothetical protein
MELVASVDLSRVDCQLCGGIGHSSQECSRVQPTALMDFLRNFQAEDSEGPSTEPVGDWVAVSDEKVLQPAELVSVAAPTDDVHTKERATVPAFHPPTPPAWHPTDPEPVFEPDELVWRAPSDASDPGIPELAVPEPAPPLPPEGEGDGVTDTPPVDAAAPDRLNWRLAALATVAAAALVVAVSALLLHGNGSSGYPAGWDPRVARIAGFVQSDRGMSWKHPVAVRFLNPTQFEAKLVEAENTIAPTRTDPQLRIAALRALGLISGNAKPETLTRNLTIAGSQAVYLPNDKAVYVNADSLTASVEAALAGALTHALQDQYFDLPGIEASGSDGSGAALVEGDSERVENDYIQTLPRAERITLEQEGLQSQAATRQAMKVAAVPPAIADGEQFPYDFGLTLADAVFRSGGNPALNRALAHPPQTDAQVIEPSSYTPGLTVPTPAIPNPPGELIQGPEELGEMPLVEMLARSNGFDAAWSAAQGWTNDSYELYASSTRICVALAVLDDNSVSAARLYQAATFWAATIPGAGVRLDGRSVDFRACDPGPASAAGASSDDTYQTLALRAFWIEEFSNAIGMSAPVSVCVSDQLLMQLGAGPLQADRDAAVTGAGNFSSLLTSAQQDALGCTAGPAAPAPAG